MAAGSLRSRLRRRAGERGAAAFAALIAILCAARGAAAEGSHGEGGVKGTRIGWPCAGCVTVVPPSYSPETPTPLFVALHGDEGSTRVVLKLWKASVEKRGYILLALLCPKDKRCAGSYWRWAGDPAFMLPPLDAVEAAYNVDRARIYLSGWSGGSTYMGMSAPAISPRFAALNLNAGGIPPEGTTDCAPCKAPVYYFMGGRNPFAHLAEATRDYYTRCGHDVVWDFAKDLDHPGELMALSKATRQEKILAWFDDKRNHCLDPQQHGSASGAAAGTASSASPVELDPNTDGGAPPAGAPPPAASQAAPPPRQSAGPQPGCGCRGASAAASAPRSGALGGISALALALSAMLRAGKRARRPDPERRSRQNRNSPGPSRNEP